MSFWTAQVVFEEVRNREGIIIISNTLPFSYSINTKSFGLTDLYSQVLLLDGMESKASMTTFAEQIYIYY